MNYLGGMWLCLVYVEWLQRGHVYEPPCASHLWTATQEQRDNRQPCSLAYRTTTCYMGSGLTEYVV
jgi:PhoPQ-activated pathogenicity-related protein